MNESRTNRLAVQELRYFLLSALEELSNRALYYDEASRQALASLVGNALGVSCRLPVLDEAFQFVIEFDEQGLMFTDNLEGQLSATIKADNFLTVARFFRGKYDRSNDGKLMIEGELELVDQLQDIFSALEIDWEEPLSRYTGDVVAHEIKRFADDAGEVLKKAGEIFERDLDESLNQISGLFFGKRPGFRDSAQNGDQYQVEQAGEFDKAIGEIEAMQEKAEEKLNSLEKALLEGRD